MVTLVQNDTIIEINKNNRKVKTKKNLEGFPAMCCVKTIFETEKEI